jgi:hypothetical protein
MRPEGSPDGQSDANRCGTLRCGNCLTRATSGRDSPALWEKPRQNRTFCYKKTEMAVLRGFSDAVFVSIVSPMGACATSKKPIAGVLP